MGNYHSTADTPITQLINSGANGNKYPSEEAKTKETNNRRRPIRLRQCSLLASRFKLCDGDDVPRRRRL